MKVPIGVTTVKKQACIIVLMEHGVTLPAHAFVVAPNHKLIPFVIVDMNIKSRELSTTVVTFS